MSVLGTLVLVALIVFLGTVAYSAIALDPSAAIGRPSAALSTGSVVNVTAAVNLTNPGMYAIDSFQIRTLVFLTNGTLLTTGGSSPGTVVPHSTTSVPLTFPVSLAATPLTGWLLTHDARLPAVAWVNGTYAAILTFHLLEQTNFSWGAPFFGLQLSVGPPAGGGSGGVTVPVEIRFENHAPFDLNGTVTYGVRSSGGTVCGTDSLPMIAPSHARYDNTTSVSLVPGCDPRGGVLSSLFTSGAVVLPLPEQAIP